MKKLLIGVALGAALGFIDGWSAWFSPEAHTEMLRIVIGSTIKGLIAGVLIGAFARRVRSLPLGIVFGLGVGLLLALFVARYMEHGHYFAIMLPGGLVGTIVGYATQRFGDGPVASARDESDHHLPST